jgi:hypothetical protein
MINIIMSNQSQFCSPADLDHFLTTVPYSTVPQDSTLRNPSTAARSARCTLADILRMLIDRKLGEVAVSRMHRGFQGV